MAAHRIEPGVRVRVTQLLRRRDGDWKTSVTGEVLSCGAEKTGSWYAHSPNGKLLLLRVRLRKDDGELTTLTIDERSRVEILNGSAGK